MDPALDLKRRLDEKGVTIVEVMMVVGIIGFIMALISTLSYVGVTAWQKQKTRVKLETQSQNFMYVATYQLRQANPSSIAISNLAGEMNNSLIVFTPSGKSNPVSIYLKTLKNSSGQVLARQAVYSEPLGNTVTPTYSQNVVATDVMSLYFTFPKITDTSRVLINLSMQAYPFKNKAPVYIQSQEMVNIRN
jgi:Tfp pilus assembly protein PilE